MGVTHQTLSDGTKLMSQQLVAILGTGQLARAIHDLIPKNSVMIPRRVLTFPASPFRISEILTPLRPDVVVNCVAYNRVDAAELDPIPATAVNGEGATRHLAAWCAATDRLLIHISSDYVYDGFRLQAVPYKESEQVNPINKYGWTKLSGDRAIPGYPGLRYYILRTSALFDDGRSGSNNFPSAILRKLDKTDDEIPVVANQVVSPTYAPDLAHMILALIIKCGSPARLPNGVYNAAGYAPCSWAELAIALAVACRYGGHRIKPVTDLQQIAKRPAYSALDSRKLWSGLGFRCRSWHQTVPAAAPGLLTALGIVAPT